MQELLAWIKRAKASIVQFFKFQLVSVIAYWSDYALYALLMTFSGIGYVYSKIIAYIFGLFISYMVNKSWTFGVKRQWISVYLAKFAVVNVIALSANLTSMTILQNYYSIDPYLSAMASTLFSFIINFSGNKLWVFEGEKKCSQKF